MTIASTTAGGCCGAADSAGRSEVFDVGIHEKLPLGQALMLGFQNIFGMIGMFCFRDHREVLHLSVEQTAASLWHDVPGSGFVTACQGS